MNGAFDRVVVVDWSAASQLSPPTPSADAIWIGVCEARGEAIRYQRSRAEAEACLRRLLALPGRALIGFDFPMGYPQGFAAMLTGTPGAPSIWNWLERHVEDAPDNRNNRFALASGINRQLGGPGPFWGRPAGMDLPELPERKRVDYAALGLAERRRVEGDVPKAQPVWKLFTTGSVGSQAIMGLPMIARLARAPDVGVWPFGAEARVVLAEVYPSLLGPAVTEQVATGEIKDAAQVRLLARALWRLAGGQLGDLMADVPDWPGLADEGWILGAGHGDLLQEAARWA